MYAVYAKCYSDLMIQMACHLASVVYLGGELFAYVQRLTLQKVPITMEEAGFRGGEEEDCSFISWSVHCLAS